MRIDAITVSIYDDDTDEQYEVILFPNGDDVYPDNIELPEHIEDKIYKIKNEL